MAFMQYNGCNIRCYIHIPNMTLSVGSGNKKRVNIFSSILVDLRILLFAD